MTVIIFPVPLVCLQQHEHYCSNAFPLEHLVITKNLLLPELLRSAHRFSMECIYCHLVSQAEQLFIMVLVVQDSLAAQMKGSKISVHMASPGMVATSLLLQGVDSPRSAKFINILAESPQVVAQWLVPRFRGVQGNGKYFK